MQGTSQVDSGIRTDGRVPLGFGDLYASAGDHIGHFYQSNEEEKNVLVSFVKAGIEAGDKCVCLMGAGSKHHELRAALADAGIDVEHAVTSGQLTFDEGKSQPEELKQMLAEAIVDIPAKFPLLRWVGVMSWALKKVPTTEKLMEWESHCNCVEDPVAIFLCQYELPMFLGNVVMDAMKTHPICIISGVIHRNPYYLRPEEYLEELHHRDATSLA